LWTPGAVRFHLTAGKQVRFACSTDPIDLRKVRAGGMRQVSGHPADVKPRVKRVARGLRLEAEAEGPVKGEPRVERDPAIGSGQAI